MRTFRPEGGSIPKFKEACHRCRPRSQSEKRVRKMQTLADFFLAVAQVLGALVALGFLGGLLRVGVLWLAGVL